MMPRRAGRSKPVEPDRTSRRSVGRPAMLTLVRPLCSGKSDDRPMAFRTIPQAIEDAAKAEPTRGFRFVPETGVPGFAGPAAAAARRADGGGQRGVVLVHRGRADERALRRRAPGARPPQGRPRRAHPARTTTTSCSASSAPSARASSRSPIYPPMALGQLQAYLDNTRHIVAKSGARALVTTREDQAPARHGAGRVPGARAGRRHRGDPRVDRAAEGREDRARRRRVPPVHERLHVAPEGRHAHARRTSPRTSSASWRTASACAPEDVGDLVAAALPRHGAHRLRARAALSPRPDRLSSRRSSS